MAGDRWPFTPHELASPNDRAGRSAHLLLRFFFGDENEYIEEFIDENKSTVDGYLEEINRHAIGGFTFSSSDEGVDASSTVRELLQHLEENYFNVDET